MLINEESHLLNSFINFDNEITPVVCLKNKNTTSITNDKKLKSDKNDALLKTRDSVTTAPFLFSQPAFSCFSFARLLWLGGVM